MNDIAIRVENLSKQYRIGGSPARIKSLWWKAKHSLKESIARAYPWIEAQVRAAVLG